MSDQYLVLQTVPIAAGYVDAFGLIIWSGTSSPRLTGQHDHPSPAALSITIGGTGTQSVGSGSIPVTWSWTSSVGTWPSESGTIDIGSNYTAGDLLHIAHGISVIFPAGNVVAGNLALATTGGAYRRLLGHRQLVAGDFPVDMFLRALSADDRDIRRFSMTDRLKRTRRKRARKVELDVNWMDGDASQALDEIESQRRLVSVCDNYGPHTIFLFRGGPDRESYIGPPLSILSSTGERSYQDPITHLFRKCKAQTPMICPGPELESIARSETFAGRFTIPSRHVHSGTAIVGNHDQRYNFFAKSHPRASDMNLQTWKGSPGTPWWDPGAQGVYDPDGGFWEEYTSGVARFELPNAVSDGIRVGPTYAGIPDDTKPVWVECWVKVRGRVRVCMLTGSGTPTNIAATDLLTGEGRWSRVVLYTSAVPAGHQNISIGFDLPAGASGPVEVAISHMQCEQTQSRNSIGVGTPIETRGSTAFANADLYIIPQALPPTGTFSFWYRHPYDDSASLSSIWINGTGGGGTCELLRDCAAGSEEWVWYMDASNPLQCTGITDLKAGQWVHLAQVWEHYLQGGLNNRFRMTMYENGVQIGTQDITAPDTEFPQIKFFGTGHSDKRVTNGALCDIRIDEAALTAEEILRSYNLRASDSMREVYHKTAGREFDIEKNDTSPIFEGTPNRNVARITLSEADCHDNSLMHPR